MSGSPVGGGFQWAALSAGADPELIAAAVQLAVTGWADASRIARIVGGRLDAGLDCTAAAVLRDLRTSAGKRPLPAPAEAAAVGAELVRCGASVHVVGEPGYAPALLQAWPELGAPVWLFVRSSTGLLPSGPAVAVVGTRHASADGLRTARDLGRLLGHEGITVVSGMARGIDQAAHRGALEADGPTVAVLGAGFDVDYPAGDADLRADVAAAGGLVTELVPGAGPRPRHFPARNRIVSGLADVTVVVEGRVRSGAAQTARLAVSQGREVLAVPGSINAPTARAPLDLIRDGARVLTRLHDVLEVLGVTASSRSMAAHEVPAAPEAPATPEAPAAPEAPATPGGALHHGLEPESSAVLALLGAVPAGVGELATVAGLPVHAVLAAAGELVGRGLALTTPRGLVRR